MKKKLTVPDVLPYFRAYVRQPGNHTGGSLHIVLDDRNVEDDHVFFCHKYALEHGDEEGARLARMLLSMSRTQRHKLAFEVWA